MKKVFSILLVMLAMFVMVLPASAAANLQFSFAYDFSADVNCSTLLTTNCVKQFRLYHVDATNTQVTDQTIPLPTTISTTAPQTISFTQKATIYGAATYYVVAQASDTTGAIVESAPVSVTVTVRPGAPTTFTGK